MNPQPPHIAQRVDRLNALGQIAINDSETARLAVERANASAADLWREVLESVLDGVELETAVRAGSLFGDAVGPLNIRERQTVDEALVNVAHSIVYPENYNPDNDRPGQSWTADGGEGIQPDEPAGPSRVMELRGGSLHELSEADLREQAAIEAGASPEQAAAARDAGEGE